MPFVSFLDENSGMGEIMMKLPESMRPFSEMVEVILRGPSDFSVGEREMIGAFVSASNNCSYCYGSHAATAKKFGIDETLFEALLDDIETAAIEEKLKPILRYVKKLTETPYKMTQADADAIYAAGWGESALSDAVLICGMFNMANRVVEGHGVNQNLSSEIFEQSAERLSQHGYLLPE
jgi:uncharacterized peroxidase-related enzyme